MNAEKWHYSQIHIAIDDESQGSIAKNLRCDELLYNNNDNDRLTAFDPGQPG